MSPRTPTLPATDQGMWRKLLAKVHPDAGGTHELFVWTTSLRERVAGDDAAVIGPPRETRRYASTREDDRERVPFDAQLGFVDDFVGLTHRALSIGKRVEEPYRSLLALLLDCPAGDHGRRAERQCRGASYKQLCAIAHMVPMSKAERCRWYEIARSIPLADAHAHHILSSLREQAA